ncbi:venom allergen 5-like isoform X2 [Ceratitis capitata]|uniref:venom allergen 5-like isoform X2 n=1 Tax=Ceratitis capitata TaxID=7213 RepID=UPI000A116B10|nr:venom allergen 5-like isoform X2 [Ceratitis capitata]
MINPFKYIFLYLIGSYCFYEGTTYNYFCGSEDWCEKGKHLMCDSSEISKGTFKHHVPPTFKVRRLILEQHNNIRNNVAKENSATRMRNLIWDHELAFLARTHTGLCPDKPSVCHKTARFEKVGHNTASKDGERHITLSTLMTTAFSEWQAKESAAFKVLAHDQISRVGCAIGYCVDCTGGKKHCYFVSCFYDMDHKEGVEIHIKGTEAASKCNVWDSVKDEKYTSLCHNTGKIFNIKT